MNDLLVTLADEHYVDQAKQLFSSAYFNAGWRGDYMLLAHEIPDEKLAWFRAKGILVKKCAPLHQGNIGRLSAVTVSRFYVFSPEFKRWKNIIYLDADIIIRASLEHLARINGFRAVREHYPLKNQFSDSVPENKKLWERLSASYDLTQPSFNAALMAFSTSVIREDTFENLKSLFHTYKDCHDYLTGEQPTLNLYFYKRWRELPYVYNAHPLGAEEHFCIPIGKMKAIAIHFACQEPWESTHPFYREWRFNLERIDKIDLKNPRIPHQKWSRLDIELHWIYLRCRRLLYTVKKLIGSILRNLWLKSSTSAN